MSSATVIRHALNNERRLAEQAREPQLYPGKPSYDHATGSIVIGQDMAGLPTQWQLHEPETGRVHSALLSGPAGTGRTNLLRLILHEAMGSGAYVVVPGDVSGTGGFDELIKALGQDSLWARGKQDCLDVLEALAAASRDRLERGNFSRPGAEVPGILIGLDDADAILATPKGARLVGALLEDAGHSGVGLILVTSGIVSFESDPDLMRALASTDVKSAFSPDGAAQVRYLEARYSEPRPHSVSQAETTFVIHHSRDDTTVGVLIAWAAAALPTSIAQSWSRATIGETEWEVLIDWTPIPNTTGAWQAMDTRPNRWHLHHHHDAWTLSLILSNWPTPSPVEALTWANQVIDHRMEVARTPWRCGPGTSQPDQVVFYADATGGITPRDRSQEVQDLLTRYY